MNDCGLAWGKEGEAVGSEKGRRRRRLDQPSALSGWRGTGDGWALGNGKHARKCEQNFALLCARGLNQIVAVAAPTQPFLAATSSAEHCLTASPYPSRSQELSAIQHPSLNEQRLLPSLNPPSCPGQSVQRKTPSPSNKVRSSMRMELTGRPTQSAGLSLADALSWCVSSGPIDLLAILTDTNACPRHCLSPP